MKLKTILLTLCLLSLTGCAVSYNIHDLPDHLYARNLSQITDKAYIDVHWIAVEYCTRKQRDVDTAFFRADSLHQQDRDRALWGYFVPGNENIPHRVYVSNQSPDFSEVMRHEILHAFGYGHGNLLMYVCAKYPFVSQTRLTALVDSIYDASYMGLKSRVP